MPRLKTETFGSGDQTWLASDHAIGNAHTGTIHLSAFTAATHYPNGYLPSGLIVNIANLGAIAPFTGTEGGKLGFVLFNQPVVGSGDFAAAVIWHGSINKANLPVTTNLPATAPAGYDFI